MSRARRVTRMSEEQIAALAEAALADLAARLAQRAFRPLPPPAGPGAPPTPDQGAHLMETDLQGDALARLHTLVHLRRAAERLTDQVARDAVEAGAGYPQLGEALEMSRQGARKRWPGLVPAAPSHPPTERSPR
ncbi:hypothetical protein GCM10010495_31640 [Kitasatospora herbaricolor]|uniref:hypothetical protein n=1 Tax=Kitasatospora herbaricolor TaxID=68217 RepID=UPI00198CA012|nr:hypothetical protein [Kitasatospora herbaricolor]MDQ0312347.1 hypothetical protein [Kitasatospora herbaricolor]GGV15179.1 hypothetical protein GCM10010495_31640 [Kitasatospora herbaricolor]